MDQEPQNALRGGAESGSSIANKELWEALREWRLSVAREKKVSAFIILFNSALSELCEKMPSTLEELKTLSKFGPRKTEAYGAMVLEIIDRFRCTV